MLWLKKFRRTSESVEPSFLRRTLPDLLDEGCDRTPNPDAFHQWTTLGWQTFSNRFARSSAEDLALGLLHLGLDRGDRVALLMHSDVQFCIADMGSLLAGLVNVPIDLTQTIENIIATLQHSEAKVLIVSNLDLLNQVSAYLGRASQLQHVIVAQVPAQWGQQHLQAPPEAPQNLTLVPPPSACLSLSEVRLRESEQSWPYCTAGIQVWSLESVQRQGRSHRWEGQFQQLRDGIRPQDLATLIYIPDAAGQLQAVMLTHENLSHNALSAFSSLPSLKRGSKEVVLSFLPLNHVLARSLLYGHMAYGHSIYFTTPHRVLKHLQEVSPTILTTVPLLLEKVYSKLLEAARKPSRFWLQRWLQHLGVQLAQRYELGRTPSLWDACLLKLLDPLIFARWRSLFGGRLRYLLSGGAALDGKIANLFAAAGIRILQGYGLTQTSAVVCVNRERANYAGTVGKPIAGAEVKIAPDGEIMVRGPSISPGYYKNPELTRSSFDPQGWMHTGDLGVFTTGGCLKVTGLKKDLFKLATGKYIAPLPIEQRLRRSPLVAQAVVVGADRKFCGVLLFPNWQMLRQEAQRLGLALAAEDLLHHPWILKRYQAIVEAANCHLPYWSAVKQFRLIPTALAVEKGSLAPIGQLQRAAILERFASEIDALYGSHSSSSEQPESPLPSAPPSLEEDACPAFARSLNPRFTT
ncbi:AMP-dependent synthetase/ligase [Altericista sp. CCNU0014]|uniref:AMP-dependent synthetase/ligase n=1 Tax=Altericista sp. CCNU0014 TaxID=3082949 RepID=UPI0038507258